MDGRQDGNSDIERLEPARPAVRRQAADGPARRFWSVNGDFVAFAPNGVARYAREVTLALDRLIAQDHPLARGLKVELVAPRASALPLEAIAVRIVPEFSRPRLPQFWVQVQLPRHVQGGLLSFCNLAPVLVKRQIVCIHDLHTRLMPESYGFGFRLAHRIILPLLGRRAARITTVSQLSRQHLAGHRIAAEDRITVTYNGSDHVERWNAWHSNLQVPARRGYVLCLGQTQRYKNVEILLRLCPLLQAMGLEMWMAGDVDRQALSRLVAPLPENLRLLGRISDHDLKKALRGALCFLFPSRIEGFGLPAVEAMRAGCPVVASTAPCLPEVCGEAALYADPDDLDGWASAISDIERKPSLRAQLSEAGRRKSRDYSWRTIAEIYLKLMAEVDGI